MRRIGCAVLAAILCLTLLTGCGTESAEGPQGPTSAPEGAAVRTSGIGFYFDTVVTLTFYGAEEGLMEQVWMACERYENLLSKTIEGSDVQRINASAGKPVTVDPETWMILQRAKEINRLTGGAFSITIAPLSAQWDFVHGTNRMPTDEERLAALPLVNDELLVLGEDNTVTLPEGMEIDLGGIAKGYIADRVAELIRDKVHGATLSFGGNVYAVGLKPDGTAFNLGIQDPDAATGAVVAVVQATDMSLVTSGIYERYFMVDDVRYHHILDPQTGLPSDSDLASASILDVSSMDADALATACIVLGLDKAKALLEELGRDGVFITRDGVLTTTEGFADQYPFRMAEDT